jgi:hypothetical protein
MPDAHGNFKGMSVPAAAWERIFGPKVLVPIKWISEDEARTRYGQPNRDNNSTNK